MHIDSPKVRAFIFCSLLEKELRFGAIYQHTIGTDVCVLSYAALNKPTLQNGDISSCFLNLDT
jgi:hypothetical protein